jgi:Ubiquitin elongating factor core
MSQYILTVNGDFNITQQSHADAWRAAHFAGKQKRKTLRVRDPEKYRWRPQELLAELAHIYLHLSAADGQGSFVAAIAADQRSYHEGLFSEAADVRCSEICVCAVLHAWLPSLLQICTPHTAW